VQLEILQLTDTFPSLINTWYGAPRADNVGAERIFVLFHLGLGRDKAVEIISQVGFTNMYSQIVRILYEEPSEYLPRFFFVFFCYKTFHKLFISRGADRARVRGPIV